VRQLPADGRLLPSDIARVVVGWAPESQNWHLGLFLAAQPESGYKTRWCGLVSWPSGIPSLYSADAQVAGQRLAEILDRPYYLVAAPPEPVDTLSPTQALQVTTPMPALQPIVIEEIEEPDLEPQPQAIFEFDNWEMRPVSQGFLWHRRAKWRISMIIRAVGFAFAALLFMILGIGTRIADLAKVNPGWLPTIGLVVGIILGLLALQTLWAMLNAVDILFDLGRREVRARGPYSTFGQWRIPFDQIGYLVISQEPARPQGRSKKPDVMRTVQEVWLHLYNGERFIPVAELGRIEGQSHGWDTVRKLQKVKGRRRLRLSHYDTPAHHAALIIARAAGFEVWLDIR
jgi:hypothetical protein